ncbi:MAG: aspartate/glutamate racemase family protein [Proteobacteria bacterium]|jgi:allantoin racemase|nr:aspartate/glutamate racemase family protein [Pseudomonadota bacterium]
MKILLVNPNTSEFITERMVLAARAAIGEAGWVVGVTADHGPAVVGSRAENALAAVTAMELAARHAGGCDAVLLGISTDAGLAPLRELLDIPVVGLLEAALLTASQLGGRIGLLTLGARMVPLYQEQATGMGLGARVVGWAGVELPVAFQPSADLRPVPDVVRAVIENGARLVTHFDLDVLVLSGAVLAGYREAVQAGLSVPVVDGIEAAAWQAVALGAQKYRGPRVGSYATAQGRRVTGVPDDLARLMR